MRSAKSEEKLQLVDHIPAPITKGQIIIDNHPDNAAQVAVPHVVVDMPEGGSTIYKADTMVEEVDVPEIEVENVDEELDLGTNAAPLFRHETSLGQYEDSTFDDEPTHYTLDESLSDEENQEENSAPLFRHETFSAELMAESAITSLSQDETFSEDPDTAPLFKHETMSYGTQEGAEVTPLFSHKTTSAEEQHELDAAPLFRHESILTEALPTDDKGMMFNPRETASRITEDDVTLASASEDNMPRSISSVGQASESILDSINEVEEEGALNSAVKPMIAMDASFAAILAAAAADRDGKLDQLNGKSKVLHHHHAHKHQQSQTNPSDLLTPPMTPEMNDDNSVTDEGRFEPFVAEAQQVEIESVRQKRLDRSTDNIASTISTPDSEITVKSQEPRAGLVASVKSVFCGLGGWIAGLCGGGARAT